MTFLTAPKVEYVIFRLFRRFIFPSGFLERFGRFVPYYRVNYNQFNPGLIADRYKEITERHGFFLAGKTVLEIGPGATNSSAYALAAQGCSRVYAYEPYIRLNIKVDETMLVAVSMAHGATPAAIASAVSRVTSLSQVPEKTVDVVFSHSVLEHVRYPELLFKELRLVLVRDGFMAHIVDYRDHFFKYPFYRLLFSRRTWKKWLDPGDLPGWSPADHKQQLELQGWKVRLEEIERDPVAFEKIINAISPDFDRKDPDLNMTSCVIIVRCP
jgi:SAM-dependent methyltransferase